MSTRVFVIVVVVVVLSGGCSAGADPGGVASLGGRRAADATPRPEPDDQEAYLAFARCMREQGVDMPDPEVGDGGRVEMRMFAGGLSEAGMQAAHEACESHLPRSGRVGAGGGEGRTAMLAFARCMRDHGVDMPDPDPDTGGIVIRRDDSEAPAFDPADESFQRAERECRHHLGPAGEQDAH